MSGPSRPAALPAAFNPWHARVILLGVVLLAMGRLVVCDFTWWDDQFTVHQNRLMKVVGLDTFLVNWAGPTGDIYIPLTYTVWALVAMAARVEPDAYGITLNPWLFHATNVAVHVGGAWAAFALLRRLVKHDGAALLGATLWAVHPVQVESVGWVSGLKDVLSGTLALTAMTLYVRWREDDRPTRAVSRQWSYGAALVVYVLALLAKPSAFTVPLLLVLIDTAALRTPWRRVAVAMAAFVAVTLPVAAIARLAQPSPTSASPLWVRPLVVGDSLAFYAVQVAVPWRLAMDYGRTVAAVRASGAVWYGWLLPAGVAAVAVLGYRVRRRQGRPVGPLPAVALGLFALAPLHVLGLFRFDFQTISTVADHYLYVAMIGPALLLAWAVTRRPTRGVAAVAVAIVGLYGLRAAWQTPTWQDQGTLVRQTLAVNPRSWTSYNNLAAFNNLTGLFRDERQNLETAQRINPKDLNSKVLLMAINVKLGDPDAARRYAEEIVRLYGEVRGNDDGLAEGEFSVAEKYASLGRFDEAELFLGRAEARRPGDPLLNQRRRQIARLRAAAVRH